MRTTSQIAETIGVSTTSIVQFLQVEGVKLRNAKDYPRVPKPHDGTRICRLCKQKKPLEEFFADRYRSLGRTYDCKICASRYTAERKLINKFGLDFAAIENIVLAQDGCKICHKPISVFVPRGTGHACVDHDHQTGRFRGVLCTQCNTGIGMFRDDLQRLQWAADYIRHPVFFPRENFAPRQYSRRSVPRKTFADGTRICWQCDRRLALTAFSPLRRSCPGDGHMYLCKPCNREYGCWMKLRQQFGLSRSYFDAIVEAQGGGCAICGATKPVGRWSRYLSVDHCHKTDQVRGILCQPCNTGLGMFRDDPAIIEKSISYLQAGG